MMSLRILGLAALLVITIIVATPTGSWAQVITVDIGPGICTLSESSPLNFPNPYTCGNVTITPKGTGSANVAIIDGNSDILRFLNATITANQAVSDLHIVVTREFAPGPSTSAGSIYYRTTANGIFGPTPVGNSLTVKSTVTDIASSTTQQMYLGQASDNDADGTSISLAPAQNTRWNGALTGNRILNLDFWFTLATQNDQVKLDSIVLQNKSTAGGGDEEGVEPPVQGQGAGKSGVMKK